MRKREMKISYSFGIIDLFHYGHLCALKKASEGADFHVFGLVSDETATAWQGTIVSSEQERKTVLESIRYIDKVMPQKTFDPTENIRQLHELFTDAKITLYHGSDMTVIPAELYLKSIGGTVEIVDYYDKMSPAKILEILNSEKQEPCQSTNIISTKANTLLALQARLQKSKIEEILVCTVWQYRNKYDRLFQEIQEKFQGKPIVVRSSSKNEDCFASSNAGHYESVLNIPSSDSEAVKRALAIVSASYQTEGVDFEQEQILIQSQTLAIAASGVVFTREIQSNRPYYVINYDENGSTNLVTSGGGGKTLWIARDTSEQEIPVQWLGLMQSVKEIEGILQGALLDIEFAVKQDGTVVIFQVRPLAANYKYTKNKKNERVLERKNQVLQEYHAFRNQERSLLSNMAFWNPAEIIGNQPHPLDYSLYRELITHRAWNQGLVEMGYQEVREDLMYKFGNQPYICIDYAFQSLIPADCNPSLTKKLVAYYRKKLSKDYTAHDKIEFEIVMSGYDLETEDRLEELKQGGFSEEECYEIRRSLFDLTYRCIRNYPATKKKDTADLKRLERVREEVEGCFNRMDRYDTAVYVEQIQRLLEAIQTYGTPQFSRQARCAFLANAFCRSMVAKGYLTAAEYEEFMKTLSTVAKQFEIDFQKQLSGELTLADFYQKYGHLRAGTYDICSLRYDRMNLFSETAERKKQTEATGTALPKEKVEHALKELGMSIRFAELETFLKEAIEQREYFKFVFTKSLSCILELIAEIGKNLGFERNEMSYLEIPQILSLQFYDEPKSRIDSIQAMIEIHHNQYTDFQKLILPEVIAKPSDINVIYRAESRPNFVTEKTVHAPIVQLESYVDMSREMEGKIVVVEKADPGFDWIFAKGIAGFLTKYGGTASHMAIRCAEFEIPAAIGCGEQIFAYIQKQSELTLDCKNGKITGR